MSWDAFFSVAAVLIGGLLANLFADRLQKLFRFRKRYAPNNAVELLRLERPEEWNEVRMLHPTWIPKLEKIVLDAASLPAINLSRAKLAGASFRNAKLDGADLSSADLASTDFSAASLDGARLDHANLDGVKLDEASLRGASFEDTSLQKPLLGQLDTRIGYRFDTEVGLWSFLSDLRLNMDLIYDLTPDQFEEMLGAKFSSMGYIVARRPEFRDVGYDLLITKDDPIAGTLSFIVEAKRTRKDRRASESSVRGLFAAMVNTNADRAIFVTTSELTPTAHGFAEQFPKMIIIDRNKLFDWLFN